MKKFRNITTAYLAHKEMAVKATSLNNYRQILRNHLLPEFGEKKEISEDDVQRFIVRKLSEGCSVSYVRGLCKVLAAVVKFAARRHGWRYSEWELHYKNVPHKDTHAVMALSVDHERRLLEYLRSHVNRKNVGIILTLHSGLRIGELCALRWQDIDMELSLIHVRHNLQRVGSYGSRSTVVLQQPKTDTSVRTIPLSVETKIFLGLIISDNSPENFLLSGTSKPIEGRVMRDYFKRLLRRAGLPQDIRFHSLRHSFATRCVEAECDIKTLSVMLGHSQASITMDIYVHPTIEAQRKVLSKVASYVG